MIMAYRFIAGTAVLAFIGLSSTMAQSQQADSIFGRYALPFPGKTDRLTEAVAGSELNTEIDRQIDLKSAIESECGIRDDSQFVEAYNGQFSDGGFSPSIDFVMNHQPSTGQIQWNSDLAEKYPPPASPGNVTGVRWCSGTLIADDLFLTAGHCFNQSGGGWKRPTIQVNNQPVVIDQHEIAQNMHINFNYQFKGNTNSLREPVEFPIIELLEPWQGNLDYAIVRVGRNAEGKTAGSMFGVRSIAKSSPPDGMGITIIQHPNGNPKRVEAGTIVQKTSTLLHYGDLDTYGGASGSGVLSDSGEIIGVHVLGGCTAFGFGTNKATSVEAIRKVSEIIQ